MSSDSLLRSNATIGLLQSWMVALLILGSLVLPTLALGQNSTASGTSLHAGWQAGPTALYSERTQSLGAHHLGNTGYSHAMTIQARWNGPWEVEFQGARSQVVADDGGLNGLQTEIQSAAVMMNYTLGGAEKQRASTRNARITDGFQPFIGIGIAHVDHIMKQDLEDAMGRRYHLWSDGSLRDVDQAGDHAGNANILRRDYSYESDLNDRQNNPSSGQTLAIPAQLGVRLDVSPRVRARMGVSAWLGLTDAIDDQSSGNFLSGDAMAAGFFGLGIRLGKLGKKPQPIPVVPGMTSTDAALLAGMDTDGDGIDNLRDRCPGTPLNAQVDSKGCPLDSDSDGYADYRDQEPHSPHTFVNSHGVAIDGPLVAHSTDWDTIRGQITSDLADIAGFTLRVPKPSSGWTEAEQSSLMAFQHLKETSEAMEVSVGHNPLHAGQAAHQLRANGLTAEIIEPAAPEAAAPIIEGINNSNETGHFRVQLGAFQTPESADLDVLFAGIDVVRFEGNDGLTRVVSTAFPDRESAVQYKVQMEQRGFIGAFLTTHGTQSEGQSPSDRSSAEASPQFDSLKVRFRVQLGALKDKVSTDAMNAFLEIGQVEHRAAPGWHRYLQGDYATMEAAKDALSDIQANGFADAFVVGDVSGRIVPVAEALILTQQN